MAYQIRCLYDSGDSFRKRPDQEQVIDITWENIEVAKENLQWIKAHYEYYQAKHARFFWDEKEAKEIIKNAAKQDWYVAKYDFTFNLKTDDGKMEEVHAGWCGYFETLREAEIIEDRGEWKITF